MHHHRSSLKQANATAKATATRARSKNPTGESRGPVKKVNHVAPAKLDRLNSLRQLRQQKKDEILQRKRMGTEYEDNRDTPPKVVVIVGFHTQADTLSLKRHLLAA